MDPVQMQVMKIMPVAISVIFIWLPSSLVLYSVANAAFSLVQTKNDVQQVWGFRLLRRLVAVDGLENDFML